MYFIVACTHMPTFDIETRRTPADLRKCSLSGFRKTDVLRSLSKAFHDGDLPGAQRWSAEMVGSFLGPWMVSKLVTAWLPAEVGVLAVPRFPSFVLRMYQRAVFLQQRHGDSVNKEAEYRYLCARLAGLLTLWPKRSLKLPKITSTDFRPEKIQERSLSRDSTWAQRVLLPGDPLELCIPINELAHHILRSRFGSVQPAQPLYWLMWYLEWIRWRETSDPSGTTIAPRPHQRTCPDDPCWLLWDLFSQLAKTIGDRETEVELRALHALFALDYKKSKRSERKYLLINAVELLSTSSIAWDKPLHPSWSVLLASEVSIDWVYRSIAEKAKEWENEHRLLVPRAPPLGMIPPTPLAMKAALPSWTTTDHDAFLPPAPKPPPVSMISFAPAPTPAPHATVVRRVVAPAPRKKTSSAAYESGIDALGPKPSALEDPMFLRPELLQMRRPRVSQPTTSSPTDEDDEPALVVDLQEPSAD